MNVGDRVVFNVRYGPEPYTEVVGYIEHVRYLAEQSRPQYVEGVNIQLCFDTDASETNKYHVYIDRTTLPKFATNTIKQYLKESAVPST